MVKIKFELYQNSTTAVKMEDDNNEYSIVFWVGDGQHNNVQEMVTQFDECLVNLIVKQKLTVPLPIIQPSDLKEYPSYFESDDANCLITRILLTPNIEQDKTVAPALMKAINETLNKYACFKWGPLDKCAIFDDTVVNYQFDSTTTFPVTIIDALNREFKDYHQKLIIPTNLLPDDGEQSSISARSDIAVIMEADRDNEESEDGTTLSEEEDDEETEDEENVNPNDNQTLPRLRRKRRDDDGDAVIMEADQENVNPNDNETLPPLRKGKGKKGKGVKKRVKSTTKGKRAKKRVKSTKRKSRTMNQGRRTDIRKTAQSHPFKCKYKHQNGKLCGQRYRTKSDINDHQKVHMKEQGKPSWRCPFQNCSNTDGFARKETCKQHIIKVHTQEWENQVSLNGGARSKQFATFLRENWLKKQHYDVAALVYRWSDDPENKEGDRMDIGDPQDSDKDENDGDHHDGNEEKNQEGDRMDIGHPDDTDKDENDDDCDIVLASDSQEDGDPEDTDSDGWLNLPGIKGIKTHNYKGNASGSRRRRTTDRPKAACYTYSAFVGDSDDSDNDHMQIEHLSWNELCQRKYGKDKGTIYFQQKILKPYQQKQQNK